MKDVHKERVREAEETGAVNRIYRTLIAGWLVVMGMMVPMVASAAPFAAFVMDGRTGKEIYSQNADARLHPASLTKMMTLYMAFTAIERGQVRLDSRFTVTQHAASQPPSRLGLRPGQQIELRYLIRAAAVKSANDAATVIAEGLAGSESQFGAQMTGMARALGMRNSNFRNANGLTQDGHYSSARDLSILGRQRHQNARDAVLEDVTAQSHVLVLGDHRRLDDALGVPVELGEVDLQRSAAEHTLVLHTQDGELALTGRLIGAHSFLSFLCPLFHESFSYSVASPPREPNLTFSYIAM